jgi:hypothetical protein
MTTRQEQIVQSLRALFGAFAAEATDDVLRGYAIGVGDMEPESLRIAVVTAIRECEFLPKPVQLRKFAGQAVSAESLAIAAWGDVLRAVPLGPWKAVDFADKRINATLRLLGGWPAIIERFAGAEDEKWLRLEFVKVYQSLGGSVGDEQSRPLMGLSEKQVINGELCDPKPIAIGCHQSRAITATKNATPLSKNVFLNTKDLH